MSEIILIGDRRVKSVEVRDCGEPFVDLLKEFPQLNFDLGRTSVQTLSASVFIARREIGRRLEMAQTKLPSGISLIVKECYRPVWVQKISWDSYSMYLRKKFPHWTDDQLYEENSKLNAPLEVAPHTTGGAVDLTLADTDGRWLEMGTDFNAEPLETNNATFTAAENISESAKKNRSLLVEAMRFAGFVNYPTEWWHWSYGDKYWALITGAPCAIFESRELELG